MEKIGIDVHKVASQVCIRTEDGAFVEQRIATTREAFAKHFGGRARGRVLMAASTESEWVARCLEALGHEVIVADPVPRDMYWRPVHVVLEDAFQLVVGNAQRTRNVPGRKTDVKDSDWIADLTRHGLIASRFVPPKPMRDLLRRPPTSRWRA